MIIQAGFDFELLARPLIIQHGMLMPSLVLICLDAEMQLDSVDVVPGDFAGCLVPFEGAILAALDPEYTKYFAIAHPGSFSEAYGEPDPLLDEANALEVKAAERGFQLIGHVAIDETGYMSARARSFFDQYPSHDDLPRTMFHWAHSKLGKCG
jgi:hypothetical protein